MDNLRWMRVIGDSLFAIGIIALGWFILGLLTGHSFDKGAPVVPVPGGPQPDMAEPQLNTGD
jgi:nitric oxide reductase subunit B